MKKKIWMLMLTLGVLILAIFCRFETPVMALEGSCGENASWCFSDDGTLTISGSGPMTNYPDWSSAPWYEYRKEIQHFEIKNGITSIGDNAICGWLYNQTKLTIPSSVTYVGACAISGVWDAYVYGYRTLWNMEFAEWSCLGSNVVNVHILDGSGQEITELVLDSSITTVPDSAFVQCTGLISVTIPKGVTSIGKEAFKSCENLEKVTIGDGLISIGDGAFSWCRNLININLPDSLTSIGCAAFDMCNDLPAITLPPNITTINDSLFSGCMRLSQLDIPEGVTSIGKYAFDSCYRLKTMNIPETVTTIGSHAFIYCSNLTSIHLPEGLTSIEEYTFASCESLEEINIPAGITSIGTYAFADCCLHRFTIPEGVTTIEPYTFKGCVLGYVLIHENVSSIGDYAFTETPCINIHFLGSVPSLGEYSFIGWGATVYYPCNDQSWIDLFQKDVPRSHEYIERWVRIESHDMSEAIYNNDATCTQSGTKSATCYRCGLKSTYIAWDTATGHNYVNGKCHCGACLLGDVNLDGKINMADVAKAFAHVRQKSPLTDETALICADVNTDGKINMADIAGIFAHVRGKYPLN